MNKLSDEVIEIQPEEIDLVVSVQDQQTHKLVFYGVTYYIDPKVISDVVITPNAVFVVNKT